MPDEKRQKLKDIFDAALQEKPEERAHFVNEKCAGDESLRLEVESLLSSFDKAGDFMQNTAVAEIADVIIEKTKPEKGKNLGQYEICEQIGAGGMGEVYLAKDKKLNRKVALKILNEKLSRHEINRSRFIQEARAASALNHPNIMVIHEIGEAEGVHFIVSEYIEGQTLREIIPDLSLNLEKILDISIQIANALKTAHESFLVHRDIKPENIMIRPDGFVKILDFGLAKLIEPQSPIDGLTDESVVRNETAKGIILGTVSYMSPEQAKGEKVDERTDIFSFGTLIYEMIAGKSAFGCESLSETWTKLLHLEPESLSLFVSGIPDELERIIAKMLRKKRDERYRTMQDLLADLLALRKRVEFETELERIAAPNKPSLVHTDVLELKITAEIPPNNITENFSAIIGRKKEIAEIQGLLRRSNVRLLTLTGVGGTGKTKLAKAVAGEMLPDFKDGVFFIDFASVVNPELVASTIAQPLGLSEAGDKPISEVLKDFLRERQILLVIDNFEQIIDAAPTIAGLIAAAKGLKIIITSRVLLRLSAEREFIVSPLIVPNDEAQFSLKNLLKYEAVKLFVERAKAAKSNFTLTEENSNSVVEICRRLEGLPLAIELAAARIKILTPSAILTKLENRLKLLTGGARDLPAHQQTMHGTIEWSYKLLGENEQRLFRWLAVFAGGFTFEAAEFVVNSNDRPDMDVLDCITSLVGQSLLSSKEQTDGTIRFQMLEVVREYAFETLIANGEMLSQKQFHAEYFLQLAEKAEPFLQAAQSADWFDILETELDNLRASLQWFLENETEKAARLAGAIRSIWVLRGYLTEGRGWVEAASAQIGNEVSSEVRFKLLMTFAWVARSQGRYETAHEAYEKGLAESKVEGNKQHIALLNRGLGAVSYEQENLDAARIFYEEGLKISREINDKSIISGLLNSLGDAARIEGKIAEARQFYEESAMLFKEIDNQQAVSASYINLGAITFEQGDYEAAFGYFSDALKTARELKNDILFSYSLDGFAALAARRGGFFNAACLAGAAEHLREEIGFEREPAERQFRNNYLAKLRAAMNEDDLKTASERGSKLKTEEILALIGFQP